MRTLLLAILVLSLPLGGCIDGSSDRANAAPAKAAPANPWEVGLADKAQTPSIAPHRSKADRLSDVVPPGAPRFAALDAAMLEMMASHDVPAASIAILRDGKLRYQNGYGHLDEAGTRPTQPDSMFRIASVTKPMTAAVVEMLVAQGFLSWDDPVFCLPLAPNAQCRLPISPHPSRPVADARLGDLTLRHLVEHRTGWTRGPCTEPFWDGNPIEIAKEFGIPTPPPAWRLVQWFMGTPMEFDPGGDAGDLDTYCNMGYLLLGLVAEAATGARIAALYDAYLFEPLELVGDIEPGMTLPEDRNPREPFYACDGGKTRSVYEPEEQVCWADGGVDLASALAVGGLISTAAAVGAVYEVFANDGSLRDASDVTYLSGHTGGLPGTATTVMRLSDGGAGVVGDVQAVVFWNKQTGHESLPSAAAAPYELQLFYANLLAAYAGAEASLAGLA